MIPEQYMNDLVENLSMASRPVTNPTMVLREEEDECALLFDPETGSAQILNTTAVAVYKLLDGHRTLAEVMTALRNMFEDIDAQAEEQVLTLVRDLCRLGAIGKVVELSP